MNFLSYPFPSTSEIIITRGSKQKVYLCESASSKVEIFQSLCYRKSKEFNRPLVLVFDNPHSQNLSMIDYKFDVDQIFVNFDTGLVNKINTLYSNKTSSLFIQGYSEFSMVILAPIGFVESQKIKLYETKITSTY
jgi:uncharacterized membrane protein (UPF0127 family)